MITPEQEEYILSRAYVPEHLMSLMGPVSRGDPFFLEDHLGFRRDNWVILVGYPLDGNFLGERCERVVEHSLGQFRPEYLWFAGPEIPASLLKTCRERGSDQYYRLDLDRAGSQGSLQRKAEKAAQDLIVERSHSMTRDHEGLLTELLKREKLPPRIRELYRAMPEYVRQSPDAWVLDARDKKGRLSAFYVVDTSARDFSTYVLGSHSKKNYVVHASDLLFLEMIRLTQGQGKKSIQLGLGVNDGIRRFKEKWGGVPFLNYEFCECYYGTTRTVSLIRELEGKL
jgi:hypothetical protein